MTPHAILKTKLRLERRLTEALAAWARAALEEWADGRERGVEGISAAQKSALRRLLESHYTATAAAFDPDAGAPDLIASLGLGGLKNDRLARWLAVKAERQADFITGTLARDLAAAEADARFGVKSDLDVMPKVKQPWSVVLISSLKAVARKFATRIPGIANVNTQDVAETVRGGRITVAPPGQEQGVIVKVWNSLLDGRERPTHGAAHGQDQLVENPFNVGGELLRFPGDTTLGASLGNVINCRCWTDYYLQKPDGSRVPLGVATPKVPAQRTRRPGAPIGSNRTPVPTSAITFATGRTRATVILADGGRASMTVANGAITISRGRDVLASAKLVRGADGKFVLGRATIARDYQGTGLDGLMSRSVEETNKLTPAR